VLRSLRGFAARAAGFSAWVRMPSATGDRDGYESMPERGVLRVSACL